MIVGCWSKRIALEPNPTGISMSSTGVGGLRQASPLRVGNSNDRIGVPKVNEVANHHRLCSCTPFCRSRVGSMMWQCGRRRAQVSASSERRSHSSSWSMNSSYEVISARLAGAGSASSPK